MLYALRITYYALRFHRCFVAVFTHNTLCLKLPFADENIHHFFASLRGMGDGLGDGFVYSVWEVICAEKLPAMLDLQVYGLDKEVLGEAYEFLAGGLDSVELEYIHQQIVAAEFYTSAALGEYDESEGAAGERVAEDTEIFTTEHLFYDLLKQLLEGVRIWILRNAA